MNKLGMHPENGALLTRLIREDLASARFEAKGAQFAINDGDPDRARNHAYWAARLANRAVRRFDAFAL